MPPRWMTLTIVALWLAATSWMSYRDIWPRLRPGQPPPFNIDLTEEVGGRAIPWEVFHKGNRIGFATTQVKRQQDRTFVLHNTFRFENVELFLVEIRKVESNYCVTSTGDLLSLNTRVTWAVIPKKEGGIRTEDNIVGLTGRVEDGMFYSRLLPLTPDQPENDPTLQLPAVPVSREGSVLNPMHPLNKLPGLYEGQTWRIPLVDPLSAVAAKFGLSPSIRYLNAQVTGDTIDWEEKHAGITEVTVVPCWRVEYAEAGKRPCARTWVRQSDGLVLQQEAMHEGLDLILKRELRKPRTP